MLNIFLILTAYYILKPVREALILAGAGGAEVKSYAAAGQAALLVVAVPLYGLLAGRLSRRALINGVSLFFIACLWFFYGAAVGKLPIGVVFFLWVGCFNLMVVAQFWSFANDVYTVEEGKRLFPLVAFGASQRGGARQLHHEGAHQAARRLPAPAGGLGRAAAGALAHEPRGQPRRRAAAPPGPPPEARRPPRRPSARATRSASSGRTTTSS